MKSLISFWLRQYLKQGRLIVIYILALLLFLLNAYIYSSRWEEDQESQSQRTRSLQEAYESVGSPDDLAGSGFWLTMPVIPLRFIADNNLEEVPTRRVVTTRNAGLPATAEIHRLQITGLWDIDLVFIVGMIFSFLAIVLTFDAVSGERAQGTLQMLLTTRVSRYQIVLSKFVAIVIALMLPLLVGMLANFLLLNVFGVVSIDGGRIAILGVFFIFAVLLLSFFTALGILVSSLTRNSITSLVVLLLLWVLLVLVIPGASKPVAKELVATMTPEEYSNTMAEINGNFLGEMRRTGSMDRPAAMARVDNFQFERIWDGVMEDFQGRRQSVIDSHIRSSYNQSEAAALAGRLSPNVLFKQAVSRLTGTDLAAVREFHRQAARFKQTLFSFLGAQDAQYVARNGNFDAKHDSAGLLHSDGRGYLSSNPLTAEIPRFEYRGAGLGERMAGAMVDASALAVLALVGLVLGVFAFNRYDVR